MNKLAIYLVCIGAVAIVGPLAVAQSSPTPQETKEANLTAYTAMMREDLKSDKLSILTELMALDPEKSAKFWPLYNQYDKALTVLADERIAFIRLYADNYSGLSDQMATKIALGVMDIQARRVDLQKLYFQRMSETLTAKDAARWLQIEMQIEKVVDLQILSSLPIIE